MHFSSSYFLKLIVVDRDLVGYTSFCRIASPDRYQFQANKKVDRLNFLSIKLQYAVQILKIMALPYGFNLIFFHVRLLMIHKNDNIAIVRTLLR
jgi:hypothetical protein